MKIRYNPDRFVSPPLEQSEKLSGVYKITNNVNEKFYIGSAVDFADRFKKHRLDLTKGKSKCPYLQNFFTKHSECVFTFNIIEYCEKELVVAREQIWLDETQCYNREIGFNACKIAGSVLGMRHSEESKKKMSETWNEFYKNNPHPSKGKTTKGKGQKRPKEFGEAISKRLKKHYKENPKPPVSQEQRDKQSKTMKEKYEKEIHHMVGRPSTFLGKKHSPESLKKMSENNCHLGKARTQEQKDATTEKIGIPILLIDNDGNEIKRFRSAKEAERETGHNSQSIASVCRGKRESIKGMKFKFADPNKTESLTKSKKPNDGKPRFNARGVNLIDSDGNILQSFPTITAASENLGVQKMSIISICKKQKGKTREGYMFRYAE